MTRSARPRLFFSVSDVVTIVCGAAFLWIGVLILQEPPLGWFDLFTGWFGVAVGVFVAFWEARHSVSWVTGAGVRMFPFVGRFTPVGRV
ncbi:hypothetical protein, partial [Propionicicella superfundia]|uniref:hypothetical protein n=1 Tax=Propionicicella superfundia TaxID=348582 RepID=UPI001B7FABF9